MRKKRNMNSSNFHENLHSPIYTNKLGTQTNCTKKTNLKKTPPIHQARTQFTPEVQEHQVTNPTVTIQSTQNTTTDYDQNQKKIKP